MNIKIDERTDFVLPVKKEDEEHGFCERGFPLIRFYGKNQCVEFDIKTKNEYESLTYDLFFLLAKEEKLKCPKCKSILEYDADEGDPSVGMPGYRMVGCINDNCYFKSDGQTKEIEQELIREIFPLYWIWDSKLKIQE